MYLVGLHVYYFIGSCRRYVLELPVVRYRAYLRPKLVAFNKIMTIICRVWLYKEVYILETKHSGMTSRKKKKTLGSLFLLRFDHKIKKAWKFGLLIKQVSWVHTIIITRYVRYWPAKYTSRAGTAEQRPRKTLGQVYEFLTNTTVVGNTMTIIHSFPRATKIIG